MKEKAGFTMRSLRLNSSIIATVAGAAAIGGIAIGAVAVDHPGKGDRLPVMEPVSCVADCVSEDRFNAAFDTVQTTDFEASTTTLIRVRQ